MNSGFFETETQGQSSSIVVLAEPVLAPVVFGQYLFKLGVQTQPYVTFGYGSKRHLSLLRIVLRCQVSRARCQLWLSPICHRNLFFESLRFRVDILFGNLLFLFCIFFFQWLKECEQFEKQISIHILAGNGSSVKDNSNLTTLSNLRLMLLR